MKATEIYEIPRVDASLVPIGTILPFKADEVHPDFEIFDGRVLTLTDHFDLVRHLERVRNSITLYWEEMGGLRIEPSAWRTPNLTSDTVWRFLALPKISDNVVLAIKARHN